MPSSRSFGRGKGSKAAYMTSFEPYTEFGPYVAGSHAVNYSSYQSSSINPYVVDSHAYTPNTFSAPGVAYAVNFKGPADEGSYLDNGATHHLTNNMTNMNIIEEFSGSNQLIIGKWTRFSYNTHW